MSSSLLRLGFAAVAISFMACSAAHPAEELDPGAPVTADHAITHGAPDLGRHPSVVALLAQDAGGGHLCTAAVIAPDVVLTARHCVAELRGEGIACPTRLAQVGKTVPPESLFVHLGDDVRRGPAAARGRSIVVPSGNVLCEADLALVTLDRPLALQPLVLARRRAPRVGGRIVAVGFGQIGRSGGQGLRRFRTDVPILSVSPKEFVVDESTCPGDSGGPALDPDTGEILGVISRGSVVCDGGGARNIYTRVSAFLELIDRTIGARPDGPGAEPAGDLGDACAAGSTCASGVCAGAPYGYCSRRCGPSAGPRCPNGYRCARQSGASEGVCAKRT